MKSITLFCIPYAGGTKYSYRKYEAIAPKFIKLVPLEYPGRGTRLREPLMTDIDELVDDLFRQVKDLIGDEGYSIYGHSMGGLVGCLLTRKLTIELRKPPVHLFITGTSGPSAPNRKESRHLLEKVEFLEEIKKFEGCPKEFFDDEEMVDFFEPIIRADFQASETYVHNAMEPLDVPITVITGSEEDMEIRDIRLWQQETRRVVDFKCLPGSHFFIFQHSFTVMEIISKKLFVHI